MKSIGTWCLMAGLFAAANVVAAGVMLVLGQALTSLVPAHGASVWLLYIAGAAGALAAIAFLRGVMAAAPLGQKFYHRSRSWPRTTGQLDS